MAPEQARGHPEPRSDLYALGCALFELTTGRLPFEAPDTVGYLSAHLTEEPPRPSSVASGIPAAWDDLVVNLLHKDPDRRYAHATDLAQALRGLGHASEPAPPRADSVHPKRTLAHPDPEVAAQPQGQADRGRTLTVLERYVPSALLLVAVGVPAAFSLPDDHSDKGATTWDASLALAVYVLCFVFVLVLAAALTPHSRTRTRTTGYAAAVLVLLAGATSLPTMLMGEAAAWNLPLTALSIAVYCYRDIRTRRARSTQPLGPVEPGEPREGPVRTPHSEP
ncbi:serine/threonine protein kinase [Streptomyces boluensis]|uniref:serine/threonine protein kinase n=1 Tax=Streptomyces boluensis TaxID=1775135 RepID=UPI0024843C33|nr:hypothetical protein [Streptomyces boluensis]